MLENRRRGEMVDRTLEEPLDLTRVEIDRDHPLGAGLFEHVGDEARFLHQGMTSSDVLDSALALRCVRSLDMILEGKANRDIAEQLDISIRTLILSQACASGRKAGKDN